jgi:hypothetical protein
MTWGLPWDAGHESLAFTIASHNWWGEGDNLRLKSPVIPLVQVPAQYFEALLVCLYLLLIPVSLD